MFSKTSKPTVPGSTYSSATQTSDQPGAAAQRQATATAAPPPKPAQSPSAGQSVPSIISSDLTIVGNLISSGDLQIDGKIEGDVQSQTMTIGEGATVKGSLSAAQVRISGRMEGVVHARQVQLSRTAQVSGDVIHDDLAIESGARIEGEVRRTDSEPPAKKQAAPKEPDAKAPDAKAPETKAPEPKEPETPKAEAKAAAEADEKAPAPPPESDEKAAS